MFTGTSLLVQWLSLQAMQEKKALSSRGRGRLRGFLELRRPWGFSPEARRGSQGASRAAPGKSGLHARGEGERVLALESREGTRASRRVEEGLSRALSGGGGKPSCLKVKRESEIAQSCLTLQSQGLQRTRLLRPWDFPGLC